MTRRNPAPRVAIQSHWTVAVTGVAIVLIAGCAIMDKSPSTMFSGEPEYETPQQVIPVWTDTVLHQAGQGGARGCGGRVLLYGADEKKTIQVDGTIIVYAWDDSTESQDRKPDCKYVFEADQLQNHYSKSKIGHSYSFWIPWDDAGGPRRQLTLLTRYIGRNGADVTSSPAKVILAGPVPMPEKRSEIQQAAATTEETCTTGIEPASFRQETQTKSSRRMKFKSSEIAMTKGYLTHNLGNRPTDEKLAAPTGFTADQLFEATESAAGSNEIEAPSTANQVTADSSEGTVPELRSSRSRHPARIKPKARRSDVHDPLPPSR